MTAWTLAPHPVALAASLEIPFLDPIRLSICTEDVYMDYSRRRMIRSLMASRLEFGGKLAHRNSPRSSSGILSCNTFMVIPW